MGDLNNSEAVQITGTIMVIAIIVLFLVVVFVLFLHLYAKWFWWRVEEPPPGRRRRRNAMEGNEGVERGLDLCLMRSLPVVTVEGEEEGLECAVCLSEKVAGERVRVLPKCKHGFHIECIDMWFHSHSTCPLCRSSVSDSISDQKLPTNVPQLAITTPSSSTNGNGLVIDVPPPPQMSDSAVEDESKSPVPSRLGSLKGLLSRESDIRMPPTPTSTSYANEV